MLVWPEKDPDETVIRYIDWSRHPSWIAGDTISSSSASLSTAAGMTIAATDDDDNTISQVTLSGGTADNVGKVLCAVVTDEGQTLQQTPTILVRER
jgi:hypothetical protein